MNITCQITGINYKVFLANELSIFEFRGFDINAVPSYCLIKDKNNTFAISKWVSPKRTRSYPYERIYNIWNISKKITIIPVVKDEGAAGNRDYIQWDTISLMSLLDVYVIFAYYIDAKRKGNKITMQQFDHDYVISKIKEIQSYHSSALHWNLNEIKTELHTIIDKVKSSYKKIEETTEVKLHGFSGIDNFKDKIGKDVSLFMEFSRDKAEKAQKREFLTILPEENLSTSTKAKITISNYLGGNYYFTVDEVALNGNIVSLIESRFSPGTVLPSLGDIKDGLLKMILFSNLSNVKVDNVPVKIESKLVLTSNRIKGMVTSRSQMNAVDVFISSNKLSQNRISFIRTLFEEANTNNFIIEIKESN